VVESSDQTPDDRSAIARAAGWASQVTGLCAEMVVPLLLGHGLDRWLGTPAVFAILGGGLGLTLGIWNFIRLADSMRRRDAHPDARKPRRP
jgi:F0F1-type ATP synthase assembly protein I